MTRRPGATVTTWVLAGSLVYLPLGLAGPAALAAQQSGGRGSPPGGVPAAPQWPDAQTLRARRVQAESRRLFATTEPLEFTLTADFKAVNRDRNPTSTKTFPATLALGDGSAATMPLEIRTRGHVRRMPRTCSFAPLRLEFQAQHVAGTIFEGHKALKLGTHCQDDDLYEQYVPREYAAYRIFNLLTPR